MALLPRLSSSFGPTRHELGPFFNLFNDTFNELQKLSDTTSKTFAPKFDVKEVNGKYLLEGELPGIDQKDVIIEFVDDQTLTIKGRTERYNEQGTPTEEAQAPAPTDIEPAQKPATKSNEVITGGPQEVSKHEPKHTYWISERSVGEFARTFAFPSRVDQDNVKASLKNGILSVVAPKLQRTNNTRKIEVE